MPGFSDSKGETQMGNNDYEDYEENNDVTYEQDDQHPFYVRVKLGGKSFKAWITKEAYDLQCYLNRNEQTKENYRNKKELNPLSLEGLEENSHYEPEDLSESPTEYAERKLREDAVDKIVEEEFDEDEIAVARCLCMDMTEREIADFLGKGRRWVQTKKVSIKKKLKKVHDEYF